MSHDDVNAIKIVSQNFEMENFARQKYSANEDIAKIKISKFEYPEIANFRNSRNKIERSKFCEFVNLRIKRSKNKKIF